MISSKYLVWVGFSPSADSREKTDKARGLNQMSLAANLEMHAS